MPTEVGGIEEVGLGTVGEESDVPWSGLGSDPASVISILKRLGNVLDAIEGELISGSSSGILTLTTAFQFYVPFGTDSRCEIIFVTNLTGGAINFSMSDGFGGVWFAATPIPANSYILVDFKKTTIPFGLQVKASANASLNFVAQVHIP